MVKTLYICLIWMYEEVWGGYQPQPWGYDVMSTPQLTLPSQIWGQLCMCNSIRVQPDALETAYQCLTYFICLIWMYEEVWGGYQPQPWRYGITFTPQVTLTSQIWGQLGRCNSIRVQLYSLETAYQWLTYFICLIWMYEAVWGGYHPQPWGYDVIVTPQVTLLTSQIWG